MSTITVGVYPVVYSVSELREVIINIGMSISELANNHVSIEQEHLIIRIILGLIRMSSMLSISLVSCIQTKMLINSQKYNKELCLSSGGSIEKYTAYSEITGIFSDKTVKMNLDHITNTNDEKQKREFVESYKSLYMLVSDFAQGRNWINRYDQQTLLISLFCELGELAEVLQWEDARKAVKQLSNDQTDRLAGEIADVAIYSIHFLREINVVNIKDFSR